jgi:hypothetical protein
MSSMHRVSAATTPVGGGGRQYPASEAVVLIAVEAL